MTNKQMRGENMLLLHKEVLFGNRKIASTTYTIIWTVCVGLSSQNFGSVFHGVSVAPGRPTARKNNRGVQFRLETCWHRSVGKVLTGPAHS